MMEKCDKSGNLYNLTLLYFVHTYSVIQAHRRQMQIRNYSQLSQNNYRTYGNDLNKLRASQRKRKDKAK